MLFLKNIKRNLQSYILPILPTIRINGLIFGVIFNCFTSAPNNLILVTDNFQPWSLTPSISISVLKLLNSTFPQQTKISVQTIARLIISMHQA